MKKLLVFAFILTTFGAFGTLDAANAGDNYENWTRHQGGTSKHYRFVESYAKLTDGHIQRIDFTYIKEEGWKFYITLPLIPAHDPVLVNLIIDNKSYSFKGSSPFSKMSWKIDQELIKALLNTSQTITIDQKYSGGGNFTYQSILNTKGLSDALKWAGKL